MREALIVRCPNLSEWYDFILNQTDFSIFYFYWNSCSLNRKLRLSKYFYN